MDNGVNICSVAERSTRCCETSAKVVLPHFRLATGRTLGLAHRYELKVVAWTVNSTEDALRLVEAGVDALASDIPDELVRLRKELRSSK